MRVVWLRKGAGGQNSFQEQDAFTRIQDSINKLDPYFRRSLKGKAALDDFSEAINRLKEAIIGEKMDANLEWLVETVHDAFSRVWTLAGTLPLAENETGIVKQAISEIDNALRQLQQRALVSSAPPSEKTEFKGV